MKTSENGLAIIKKFEGLRLKAYRCPAGVPTIGYGHTKGVKMGDTITSAKADELLREDVSEVERTLNQQMILTGIKLRQGQYDALVSFVFNLGMGNLLKSTLWRIIRQNPDSKDVPAQFRRWVYAGGKVLQGLVVRREEEIKLYQL